MVVVCALAAPGAHANADPCCADARDFRPGAIVRPTGDSLAVRWLPDTTRVSLAFGSADVRATAMRLRRPGRALIEVREQHVTALGVRASRAVRAGFILGVAGILLLLVALMTGGRLRQLAVGQDNRFSNSKCQTLAWFATLIVSYLATLALRWWAGGPLYAAGVAIPEKLLALSGLSALTFVGAKAITQSKVDRAETMAREQPATARALASKSTAARPSFPGDLVNDDHGHLDFGDLQMIVVTLVAVIVYAVRVFVCLGRIELACATALPDVDAALLAGFGIGQGAYLAKKAASRLGEG